MNETVMNNFIERVDPDILINFEDEAACIEFLYMVYSVNQYGAFVDVDSADLLSIFQAYQRDKNQEGSEQYPA
jgi:hypothetical protein